MTTALLAPAATASPLRCPFRWCLGAHCGERPNPGDVIMHAGRPSAVRGLQKAVVDATPTAFTESNGSLHGTPMITIGMETDTFDAQIDLATPNILALALTLTSFGNGEHPIGEHTTYEGVADGQPCGAFLTVTRIDDLILRPRRKSYTYPLVQLQLSNPDSNPQRGSICIPGCTAPEFGRYLTAIAAEVMA